MRTIRCWSIFLSPRHHHAPNGGRGGNGNVRLRSFRQARRLHRESRPLCAVRLAQRSQRQCSDEHGPAGRRRRTLTRSRALDSNARRATRVGVRRQAICIADLAIISSRRPPARSSHHCPQLRQRLARSPSRAQSPSFIADILGEDVPPLKMRHFSFAMKSRKSGVLRRKGI